MNEFHSNRYYPFIVSSFPSRQVQRGHGRVLADGARDLVEPGAADLLRPADPGAVARAQVQPVAAGPGRAPRQVLCRLVRHARLAEHSAGRAARQERAPHLFHARRLDVGRLSVLPLRAQL